MTMNSGNLSYVVLMICGALQLSGCSVIGFTVGAIKDAALPQEYVFTRYAIDSLKHGMVLKIRKVDSTICSGKLSGTISRPPEEYVVIYKGHLTRSPIGLLVPELGESIRIIAEGERGHRESFGQLIGFHSGAICVRASGETEVTDVPTSAIDTVFSGAGRAIDGVRIRRHLANGDIPLMETGLLVKVGDQTTLVPLDSILEIHCPTSRNEKWWNLGIGIVLDAVGIIVTVAVVRKLRGERNVVPWPFRF